MITLTDKAVTKALRIAVARQKPPILRVGIRRGGCSGMSYELDIVDELAEQDEVFEVGGLTVICAPDDLPHLEGLELDYDTNLLRGGFRFNNPKATQTCECGESFTTKENPRARKPKRNKLVARDADGTNADDCTDTEVAEDCSDEQYECLTESHGLADDGILSRRIVK